MRYLLTGDWHLTDRQPKFRKDNFLETQKEKLSFILNLAKQRDAIILQPGDFFDSHKASYFLVDEILALLKRFSPLAGIYTVYGQHDLRFHKSDTKNTPLNLLINAFDHLFYGHMVGRHFMGIDLYSISWNEEIPKPQKSDRKNVLLLHRMIYEEKSYPGQEAQGDSANIFLRKHPQFDLVVSGDNHKSFTAKVGDRWLVNCGALLRTSIDMKDHRPHCYIYDSDFNTLEQVDIPCKPFSEVFNFEQHELEKKVSNEKLEAYVRSLTTKDSPVNLNFPKVMREKIEEAREKLDPGVITILEEIMGDGIQTR